jgi:thiosulfate dehydrogenase
MGRLLFGLILGLCLAPAVVLAWFRWGHPPVAVADPPLPAERQLTGIPLHARTGREAPGAPPIEVNERNLVAGAQVYRDQCASCHGLHDRPVPFAAHMYPAAPALWEKHTDNDVIGVSDDPPGETYWKVANGIRLSGMPAYKEVLSDTQIWQVSLLLANADKPLPPAALDLLRAQPQPPAPPQAPTTPARH